MTNERSEQPVVARAQAHLIERPRLTKLLDQTEGKIITLIAPAGYGKTTLARQWLRDRPTAWYRATQASFDVAALAMGIAEATGHLVSGAGDRLRKRLASTQGRELGAHGLAAMLARDFEEWPLDAWLMVDDYQLAAADSSVGAFMDDLTALSPLQLLLASRDRPSWITSRRLLYGEILEIDQGLLALTDDEARSVLHLTNRSEGQRLLEHARGWPAVIGLAAMTRDFELPDQTLPLYDFFADELYHAAPESLRRQLRRLAVLPSVTEDLARSALGSSAREALDVGVRLGFLSCGSDGNYEIHPLLHQFLRNKLFEENDDLSFIESVGRQLLKLNQWDDAFALITQFDLHGLVDPLIDHGLSAVLWAGRLSTVERWLEYAKAAGVQSPHEYVAEAEVARCRGNGERGELFALHAVEALKRDGRNPSRAHAVAGECAHLQTKFDLSLKHHASAAELASSTEDARRALWGQIVGSYALENDAGPFLDRFHDLAATDPDSQLRLAGAHLMSASLDGHISSAVDIWRRLIPLLQRAQEPAARTLYSYWIGVSTLWAGRYEEAVPMLTLARREAEDSGFDLALPAITAAEAAACVGLRRFTRAAIVLDEASELCHQQGVSFSEANVCLAGARLSLAKGRIDEALAATAGAAEKAPTAAFRGEALAVHALSLAALDRWDDASRAAGEALTITRNIEARTLGQLVHAIVDINTSDEPHQSLQDALRVLNQTENFDSLVTAYRVFTPLLRKLCGSEKCSLDLPMIVNRARDSKLATELGLPSNEKQVASRLPLTRREREVLQLLCQGLRDKEIAARLFVTEVTAKAHVRNIIAKLGVRSRTEAVVRAYAEE
jgi:LuxR family transcriptional regulator, maltose regulon positive regulatory protein